MLKNIFNFKNKKRFIPFKGLNLPITRSNEGLNNEDDYLNSIKEQIDYLKINGFICDSSQILDFGCGQGRFLNGLIYTKTKFSNYTGIDTSKNSIEWCLNYLNYNNSINFIHLPSYNARYNKDVVGLMELPFAKEKFDLIFLNSVFSHMISKDIVFYLKEFYSCLKSSGFLYLTAFVEQNVPPEEENPQDYLSISSGPLHRVRYEKHFFFDLINKNGFEVLIFLHQYIERTKQSVIVLKKTNNSNSMKLL